MNNCRFYDHFKQLYVIQVVGGCVATAGTPFTLMQALYGRKLRGCCPRKKATAPKSTPSSLKNLQMTETSAGKCYSRVKQSCPPLMSRGTEEHCKVYSGLPVLERYQWFPS